MFNPVRLSIALMISVLTGCCLPSAPWHYWRYEQQYEYAGFPGPCMPEDQRKFEALYVDGAFIHVRLIAHNQTTRTGDPPFRLHLSATSTNPEHQTLVIHGVEIKSSLNNGYPQTPLNVRSTGALSPETAYPVSAAFRPNKMGNSCTRTTEDLFNVFLDLRDDLNFVVEEEEVITIVANVEVQKPGGSQRKTIEYTFTPVLQQGVMQCLVQ